LQSELLIKQAAIKNISNEKQQLKLTFQQQWGATLAQQQATTDQLLASLQSSSQVLLLITLPVGIQLPASVKTITFSPSADQATRLTATFVSTSPRSNPGNPGATFFFSSANHPLLRQNTVLDGWLSTDTESQTGVMIPDSAVIWHAGQAWVYLQTAAYTYSRRALNNPQVVEQHWFVSTGFSAGEKLVTQGAALLLSEEFRWQIPAEDDD
jgi:hypothetical protein